jgi:hypothetical protein
MGKPEPHVADELKEASYNQETEFNALDGAAEALVTLRVVVLQADLHHVRT